MAVDHSTTTSLPGTQLSLGKHAGRFGKLRGHHEHRFKEGRFITESDDQQRANVMVIGVNAAEALFPGYNQIAGAQVRMGGYNFEIVGVLEKRKAGFFGENEEDNAVYIPFALHKRSRRPKVILLLVFAGGPGKSRKH
jgi:putative ABC transport system permease protein